MNLKPTKEIVIKPKQIKIQVSYLCSFSIAFQFKFPINLLNGLILKVKLCRQSPQQNYRTNIIRQSKKKILKEKYLTTQQCFLHRREIYSRMVSEQLVTNNYSE